MSDPYWAPQHQPQSAVAGADATNVGRDHNQNTYNLYNSIAGDGVSMTYDTFKRAIDAELAAERRESLAKLQAVEDDYRTRLADAFADYKDATAERDRLRSEVSFLSGRGVALRASWQFPVAVALVSLILGLALAASLGIGEDAPTAAAESAEGTASGEGSVSAADPEATPVYQPVSCGRDNHIVQLEAIAADDPLQEVRALVLQQELVKRIENAGLSAEVHVTRSRDYCLEGRPNVEGWIFLWAGPFPTRADADRASEMFHARAVSEDGYAATIS